jgi:hypothetical protein
MVIGLSPSIIVKGDNFIVSDFALIGIQTQCNRKFGRKLGWWDFAPVESALNSPINPRQKAKSR